MKNDRKIKISIRDYYKEREQELLPAETAIQNIINAIQDQCENLFAEKYWFGVSLYEIKTSKWWFLKFKNKHEIIHIFPFEIGKQYLKCNLEKDYLFLKGDICKVLAKTFEEDKRINKIEVAIKQRL